ncbi:transposase [Agromyces sp. NPDC058110]|uniref:transposase n=1 Tax=Agromyces sp. NPDC058110 TaxID=3346345 RepID=UPI0036DD9A22
MAEDALAEIADELYGLPPEQFTAARNARAKRVRADDRALADAVAELRKPSAPAWLVNQLVRHRSHELEQLFELGAQLRAAQAEIDASAITALARERRKVVGAVASDAGALAEELGHPVRGPALDDVASTLQAAMTDATATDAVRSGRLVRSLEAIGTEVDLSDATAAWTPGDTARSAAPAPRDEVGDRRAMKQRQADEAAARAAEAAVEAAAEAEEEAAAAERAVEAASGPREAARTALREAEAARDELLAAQRDLERRLARAEREFAAAEHLVDERERDYDRASEAAAAARVTADDLRAALD